MTVRPVDVQCSALETRLESCTGKVWPVRLGLNRVNGLKHDAAVRIVQTREQGLFESVEDLTKRARLDRGDLLALADANALEQLAGHRRQAVWQTAATETRGVRHGPNHTDLLTNTRSNETPLELPKAGELEDMLADYRATGSSLEHHPISFLRKQLAPYKIKQVEELRTYPNGRLARACGIVTHRQRPATAHGTVFLNLEDETGNVNVIVWNSLAEEQRQVLRNAQIMGVFGIWQREGEVCNLVARRLVDYTHLLAQLPEFMVPQVFVHLDAFPLSPNGKLDRKALPAPDMAALRTHEYEAPQGDTEIALAQLWAELLNVERVGRHDNFFELGGHSLLAVSLIGRLRQDGIDANVKALFEQPTLWEYAEITERMEMVL